VSKTIKMTTAPRSQSVRQRWNDEKGRREEGGTNERQHFY